MSKLVVEKESEGHQHSILVGKKCAYCMDCGQILIEYKNKEDFNRLMNPTIPTNILNGDSK